MRPARTVIDTNLWISYLISPNSLRIDDLLERGEVVVLYSSELLSEFIEVARRQKFRRYFSLDRIQIVVDVLEEFGELIDVVSDVQTCRDSKDNFLLALSKDSNADYLVTGDGDLLDIKQFGQTPIVTFSEFAVRISE